MLLHRATLQTEHQHPMTDGVRATALGTTANYSISLLSCSCCHEAGSLSSFPLFSGLRRPPSSCPHDVTSAATTLSAERKQSQILHQHGDGNTHSWGAHIQERRRTAASPASLAMGGTAGGPLGTPVGVSAQFCVDSGTPIVSGWRGWQPWQRFSALPRPPASCFQDKDWGAAPGGEGQGRHCSLAETHAPCFRGMQPLFVCKRNRHSIISLVCC